MVNGTSIWRKPYNVSKYYMDLKNDIISKIAMCQNCLHDFQFFREIYELMIFFFFFFNKCACSICLKIAVIKPQNLICRN